MRTFIIDLKNVAYRAYYAFNHPPLKTSKGRLTSITFGVSSALNRIINEFEPNVIIFADDHKGKTFRHEMYPEYKANRNATDQEFIHQLPDLMRMIKAYGIKVVSAEGFEADDVIGSLAVKYASDDNKVYIVSNDKDFFQLVSENILMCRPQSGGGYKIEGDMALLDKFGCLPHQFIDCLAMMGDTADNVPGVKGIGEKTAAALIKSCGSLEGVYQNLGNLKPSIQKKLMQDQEKAFLSKSLVTIKTDIQIDLPLETFQVDYKTMLQRPELLAIFEEFEFNSFKYTEDDFSVDGPSKLKQSILTDDDVGF